MIITLTLINHWINSLHLTDRTTNVIVQKLCDLRKSWITDVHMIHAIAIRARIFQCQQSRARFRASHPLLVSSVYGTAADVFLDQWITWIPYLHTTASAAARTNIYIHNVIIQQHKHQFNINYINYYWIMNTISMRLSITHSGNNMRRTALL
jgi:hypothetical protein